MLLVDYPSSRSADRSRSSRFQRSGERHPFLFDSSMTCVQRIEDAQIHHPLVGAELVHGLRIARLECFAVLVEVRAELLVCLVLEGFRSSAPSRSTPRTLNGSRHGLAGSILRDSKLRRDFVIDDTRIRRRQVPFGYVDCVAAPS